MKNKIKSIFSAMVVFVLALPVLVSAQATVGEGISGTIPYKQPDETMLPSDTIMNIIVNIMNWLLIAIGVAGVIGFAIAGILYLTAAGNDDQIKKAKSAMMASILGVIVALAGVVALQFAMNLLDPSNTNTMF